MAPNSRKRRSEVNSTSKIPNIRDVDQSSSSSMTPIPPPQNHLFDVAECNKMPATRKLAPQLLTQKRKLRRRRQPVWKR